MPRLRLATLLALTLTSAALAQPVEFYESYLPDGTNPRGGVVAANRPVEVFAESSPPAEGTRVRLVYSADGWASSRTLEPTLVDRTSGAFHNNARWRAELPSTPPGTTLEYYFESVDRRGNRTAINGTGVNGPAGENFILYSASETRHPAPARPGEIIEIAIENLRSSQGWLHRNRGRYAPHEVFNGESRIPIVYWVGWAPQPHWALANDGNHRTFDAVRQGLTHLQVRVVEVPPIVWPARHRFLDSKVYADADLQRLSPIGTARDFAGAGPERFARPRAVRGPAPTPSIPAEVLANTFANTRAAALSRSSDRLAEATNPTDRATLLEGRAALERVRFEVLPTADVIAERRGDLVRLSQGLIQELHRRALELPPAERAAFHQRTLSLILAHELAHTSGVRTERTADRESVRIFERAHGSNVSAAEVRAALGAFERPLGASRLDAFLGRIRDTLDRGLGRRAALEAAAAGAPDRFADYRRADGTLEWRRLTADRTLREAGGLLHFTLALFLKELATTLATGDEDRLEEFFDGLTTTDFYVHYGLFALGARAGEVAYTRYLQRYVKPNFLRAALRTQLTLAAGLSLPQLVDGSFEGRTFAISLTSLGLSTAAVRSGVAAITWVRDLSAVNRGTRLLRLGAGAANVARNASRVSRLARLGGWVYTAAELAVILYVSEIVEDELTEYLDERAARNALGDAGTRLVDLANDPDTPPDDLAQAAQDYHDAWNAWRDLQWRPLLAEEARLAQRLERFASRAKTNADRNAAALAGLEHTPALRADLEDRYGSLAAYAEHLGTTDADALQADVEDALRDYQTAREHLLAELYATPPRPHGPLDDLDHPDWLFAGAHPGATGDPLSGRRDIFARWSRAASRRALRRALADPSPARLQTYDEELAVIDALRANSLATSAPVLDDLRARVARLRDLDTRLGQGDLTALDLGSSSSTPESTGLSEVLERSLGE